MSKQNFKAGNRPHPAQNHGRPTNPSAQMPSEQAAFDSGVDAHANAVEVPQHNSVRTASPEVLTTASVSQPSLVEFRSLKNSVAANYANDALAALEILAEIDTSDVTTAFQKYIGNRLNPPKHLNPDNSVETWDGNGRKPRWVREHLKRGTLREVLNPEHPDYSEFVQEYENSNTAVPK
jgi:DNA-binding protein H-NS